MTTITFLVVLLAVIGSIASYNYLYRSIHERYRAVYKKHKKKWDWFFRGGGFGLVIYTMPKEVLDELDRTTRWALWLCMYLPAAPFPFVIYQGMAEMGFRVEILDESSAQARTDAESSRIVDVDFESNPVEEICNPGNENRYRMCSNHDGQASGPAGCN
jgi:hypothetical protein